ncbi:MAG: beta-ketoacyl synthase [Flavobacteriaceae bacterium]|nr:beta-ketoacyl synthase [Flavobacteriaceae bacterium]
MKSPVSITALASLSALGSNSKQIWENYQNEDHFISKKEFKSFSALVAQISEEDKIAIQELRNSDSKYVNLDDSVLYCMYVSRKAVIDAGWKSSDNFGINIGSSRGATSLFEKYHKAFLESNVAETLSSPTTTLGNISSWTAHDLQTDGPEISHSIACSTGLHALLNGVVWVLSGMANKFLVGGSEAALTDFTIAQMKALKIYAKNDVVGRVSLREQSRSNTYPCQALNLNKKQNTMVLGEGAAVLCLEKGVKENALAVISGVGYATEILEHNVSISTEATCFQKSMKMALGEMNPNEIDVIVMHAPGTIKGDLSEVKAIEKVFGKDVPFLTTNKWKLGHTFATSGLLSIELAVLMLQHQQVVSVPFIKPQRKPKQLKNIVVNAVGFGGNAVSVLLTK